MVKNNLNDLLNILYKKVNKDISVSNFKRLENALNYLKIDFSNIKKYHITGTNGKGSVCQLLNDFLLLKFKKVGKFTSPHLIKYNERIMINNQMISDEKLLYYLNLILFDDFFNNYSFFEITFIISLLYFFHEKVDCMIIEVGIGGSFDITNYFKYDYSFITNYSKDHIEKLGPSKKDIFLNKFGILKENGVLFTNINTYKKYMINMAKKLNSKIYINNLKDIKIIKTNPLIFEFEGIVYKTKILGNYQAFNFSLVLKYINLYEKFTKKQINQVLKNYIHYGRFEKLAKNIYIDGAHNIDGINKFIETVKSSNFQNINIITSILKPKDYKYILKSLSKSFKNLFYLEFIDERNYKYEEIYEKSYKIKKIELNDLIFEKNRTYIFTGSLHFIGFIKDYIGKKYE